MIFNANNKVLILALIKCKPIKNITSKVLLPKLNVSMSVTKNNN